MAFSSIHNQFYILLEDALKQATLNEEAVLVSSVAEVSFTDLPAFFSYRNNQFKGNRFFWSEPGRELSFVGLGSVLKIEATDSHRRYERVNEEWSAIAKNAKVSDGAPSYTGPILFGGYSFDPEIQQTELWSDFKHTSFCVPQFMLTVKRGKAWLTINAFVEPGANLDRAQFGFNLNECRSVPVSLFPSLQPGIKEEIAPSNWIDAVAQATKAIRHNELEKVVLARSIRLQNEQAFQTDLILRQLLVDQLNTYVFAIEHDQSCFIGATPERLIKREGAHFQTLSLAGSIGRGDNPSEDETLSSFLRKDSKNLHEHALAVQMIKGAMDELCDRVDAPEAPIVVKLKDLQHLATPIKGQAKEGVTILQAVEALHPTPALGGMPREAAMDSIRALENMDRGWYAAPIGWMNIALEGEFAAGIRSALIKENEAFLFAGCGVVSDSDPMSEYHETALKFRPMLAALQALEVKA